MNRYVKTLAQKYFDVSAVFLGLKLSLLIEKKNISFIFELSFWLDAFIYVSVTYIALVYFGVYKVVIRFSSSRAFWNIFQALFFSTLLATFVTIALNIQLATTTILTYFGFSIVFLLASRFLAKYFLLVQWHDQRTGVAIYGAGESGLQLARMISASNRHKVVFFIDDNISLQGSVIGRIPVYGFNEAIFELGRSAPKTLLLALPDVAVVAHQEKLKKVLALGLEVRTIPKLTELISGQIVVSNLKKISVQDLLGRDIVPPKAELMSKNNKAKVVMVTGAGGSIGSHLCEEIILQKPLKLILFETSEFNLYQVLEKLNIILSANNLGVELIGVLGSIQDKAKVSKTIRQHSVNTIYHAAAYKHVPLVQNNVIEGVKNNVFGTLTLVEASLDLGVSSFVLVSTDKAVRPTSYMGASKRLAELICQAVAKKEPSTTFSIVRFGNVLGSSGSVIPKFEKQINDGGPLSVTHKEVTRYFMTTFEAAQLVIQAGSLSNGGDVFVLEMGKQVKILDLAFDVIRLNGFAPYLIGSDAKPINGIGVKLIGLRDGEKLYEEKFIGKAIAKTTHPKIFCADEEVLPYSELKGLLDELKKLIILNDEDAVAKTLRNGPVNFQK